MPLFKRFRRKEEIDAIGIEDIRSRVRAMREQIGRRDLELADLFELVGEDDRKMLQLLAEKRSAKGAAPRLWPDQVPSTPQSPADEEPKVTYGNWELMRPPIKFGAP